MTPHSLKNFSEDKTMSELIIPNNLPLDPAASANAKPDKRPPEMSALATITGIFFEPATVFTSMRERPRFLVAMIVCIAAFMLFNITYFRRLGFETVIRAQTESNPRAASVTPEEKEEAIQFQLKPIVMAVRLLAPIVVLTFFFTAGAVLYLMGAALMGGQLSYKRALSVWAYSSLPPAVFIMLVNFVLLLVALPDDDLGITRGSRRGLVHANLGVLLDPKTWPVLGTALAGFDIFTFYGLFLGALGLRKVGRMSTGAAWGTVISLWLIGLLLKVGYAAVTGTGM
jgi:hypothetical protein